MIMLLMQIGTSSIRNVVRCSSGIVVRCSSGISEGSYHELLKHISKLDKIKSDKFKTLLPHIQQRNKHPSSVTKSGKRLHGSHPALSDAETLKKKLEQPYSSDLTNIFDPSPKIEDTLNSENNILPNIEKSVLSKENSSNRTAPESIGSADSPNAEKEDQPPKSLPVLISSLANMPVEFQADLTSAALPLSLHRGEDNFLTAAVAKDLKQVYFKTMETTEHFFMLAQQEGNLMCKTVVESTEYSDIRQKTRENAIALIDKSAIWLCDPKPAATTAQKDGSIVDKIKKVVENVLATLKQKLEEQKKSQEKKKDEESKKEAKT